MQPAAFKVVETYGGYTAGLPLRGSHDPLTTRHPFHEMTTADRQRAGVRHLGRNCLWPMQSVKYTYQWSCVAIDASTHYTSIVFMRVIESDS